jgi:hypothetical protein
MSKKGALVVTGATEARTCDRYCFAAERQRRAGAAGLLRFLNRRSIRPGPRLTPRPCEKEANSGLLVSIRGLSRLWKVRAADVAAVATAIR